ncbi:MAG: hypothetical protein ACOYT4_03610 [Nanoarchaeota archaeon]
MNTYKKVMEYLIKNGIDPREECSFEESFTSFRRKRKTVLEEFTQLVDPQGFKKDFQVTNEKIFLDLVFATAIRGRYPGRDGEVNEFNCISLHNGGLRVKRKYVDKRFLTKYEDYLNYLDNLPLEERHEKDFRRSLIHNFFYQEDILTLGKFTANFYFPIGKNGELPRYNTQPACLQHGIKAHYQYKGFFPDGNFPDMNNVDLNVIDCDDDKLRYEIWENAPKINKVRMNIMRQDLPFLLSTFPGIDKRKSERAITYSTRLWPHIYGLLSEEELDIMTPMSFGELKKERFRKIEGAYKPILTVTGEEMIQNIENADRWFELENHYVKEEIQYDSGKLQQYKGTLDSDSLLDHPGFSFPRPFFTLLP